MKFLVFLVLSIAALSLATPLSPASRVRRQEASSTAAPGCTQDSGLAGLLEQVGNLLGNLLDNLLTLQLTADLRSTILPDLLRQVRSLLDDLLRGDDSSQNEALLQSLLSNISNLLDSVMGSEQAGKWTCTTPTGPAGILLTTVLGTLGGVTDNGFTSALTRVILNFITSLLNALV